MLGTAIIVCIVLIFIITRFDHLCLGLHATHLHAGSFDLCDFLFSIDCAIRLFKEIYDLRLRHASTKIWAA
jgi:hypothetical protein